MDLGDGAPDALQAGFHEVGAIGAEVPVGEYRSANAKDDAVVGIMAPSKYPGITLKRGITGSLVPFQWWRVPT